MELPAILPLIAVSLVSEAATAQTAPAQTATIAGIVINTETGEPLSGVHIGLSTWPWAETPLAFGGMSGPDGHFSIGAIQPGTYRLWADLRGFSFTPTNGDPQSFSVSPRPGQHIADFKVEMARHAVIAGRVVDENGDPVANAGIAVLRQARDSLSANGAPYDVTSDDLGEFRWAGPPGKYYVRADQNSSDPSAAPEIRTDGTSQPVYGLSYYPDATSADRAAIVSAAAGKTASNIEIRLVRRRTFAISGAVTGAPEDCKRFTIALQGNDGHRDTTRGDAGFSFGNLFAGDYTLYGECLSREGRLRSPVLDLKLDGADRTNLSLDLTHGGDLAGGVEMPDASRVTVRLEPLKAAYYVTPSTVQKDGSFRVQRVPRDRFRVVVGSLPENAYVRSMQLDDTPVTDGMLDLTQGADGSKLKIVVSISGAQVTGAVVDNTGSRVLNSWDGVYLVADPDNIRPEERVLIDAGGNFAFHAIRPGRYRLFATEGPFEPEALKGLAAAAEIVTIQEGDRIVRELKLP